MEKAVKILTLTFLAPNYLRKLSICNTKIRQKTWRNAVKTANKKITNLMEEISAHENIYKTYNPNEKVFVRIWKKKGKFLKDIKY